MPALSGKLYAKGSCRHEGGVLGGRLHVSAFSLRRHHADPRPGQPQAGSGEDTVDELVINEQYRRMAEYYGCAVVPGRPRRPGQGSRRWGSGLQSSRRSPLSATASSHPDSFQRGAPGTTSPGSTRGPSRARGSRDEIFLRQEKALLVPLPGKPLRDDHRARPPPSILTTMSPSTEDGTRPVLLCAARWRSAPPRARVWVVCDGERIAGATKRAARAEGSYSTNPDHMPDAHRDFSEWNGDRFRRWAKVGSLAPTPLRRSSSSRAVEQQSSQILQGGDGAGRQARTARARAGLCQGALLFPRPSHKTIKSIIAKAPSRPGRTRMPARICAAATITQTLDSKGDIR